MRDKAEIVMADRSRQVKRRRLLVRVGLFGVVVLAVAFFIVRSRVAPKAPPLAGDVVAVERGAVRRTVSGDGVLRALTTVEVKSYAGGRVDRLVVDVGSHVSAGDLIAVIDPTDSQTAYDQATADLNVARSDLEQAQAQDRVQDELTQASIAQARAAHAAAAEELARLKEATHPKGRADAKSALDQALAALDSAQEEYDKVRLADHPQARSTAQSEVERSAAALDAAQKDLERLKSAQHPQALASARAGVDKAQAALETAQRNLDRLRSASHPKARVEIESGLAKARSELSVAARALERAKGLRAEGFISQSELDAATATYEARKADFQLAEEKAQTLGADQSNELKASELSTAQAQAELASVDETWRTIAQQHELELRAAEAKVVQAKADLAAAQKKWETLDSQQAAELKVAEAKVAQARAALESSQERWRTLDRDQATEAASALGRLAQTEAALKQAETQAVDKELRRAAVLSARAKVLKAQASVKNAATMLGYTTITAPRDGVILTKAVEEGTIITSGRSSVTSGTTIVTLGDISRMFVDVKVDESDVREVRLGQRVDIQAEAYSDEVFAGKVTRIDPQATTTSNVTTVQVEVEIAKPDARLLPGLTANCEFLVDEVKDALVVPRRAVLDVAKEPKVRVVVDGVATETPVKIGLKGDEEIQILSGVSEGDHVLVPRLGTNAKMGVSKGVEMGRKMGGGGFTAR